MSGNLAQNKLVTLQSCVPSFARVGPDVLDRAQTLLTGSQTLAAKPNVLYIYPAGAAAATFTFTAASLQPLNMQTGDVFTFTIINASGNTITVTPAVTVTANGVTGAPAGVYNDQLTVTIRNYIVHCTSSVGTAANPNGLYTIYSDD